MATGIQSTYDFSIGVKINMDEAIYLLSPMDSPLLAGTGTDGNSILSSQSVDETTFYWMDEEALLPRSQLGAAATTGTTILTLQANHGLRFSTGDIVVHHTVGGTERMQVVVLSATTADTIHVTRAYSGTATDIASGVEIVGLGTALAEGSDPEDARSIDRTETFNYTQIFGPTKVSITRSEQGRAKYGISDEVGHQMMLRMAESAIGREQALLYGERTNSTTTKIRTTGGLSYFLTSNVDSTNTEITVANVQTNQADCYDAGGLPDQLWVNPLSTGTLNAANDSLLQTVNTETRRGSMRTQFLSTEYGDIDIVRNRYVHRQHAFGVQKAALTRRVFDPLVVEKLAKTGDAENWQFVCEEGLEVKGEAHCFKMNNLTAYA